MENVGAESSTKRPFWLGNTGYMMILYWFWEYPCGIKSTRHSGLGQLGTAHTWVLLVPQLTVWNEAFTRHSGLGQLVLHTREFCWFQKWECGMKLSQDILACNTCVCVCTCMVFKRVCGWRSQIIGQTAHQISLLNFVAADSFIHGLNLKTDFLAPDSFSWSESEEFFFGSRQMQFMVWILKKCFW
jgi:hypothetical protein